MTLDEVGSMATLYDADEDYRLLPTREKKFLLKRKFLSRLVIGRAIATRLTSEAFLIVLFKFHCKKKILAEKNFHLCNHVDSIAGRC